ncbi:Dolichyl pyrophosphate Man9GlcNAc2 alpha-1,3-glucosyltransferase [Hypsizygus marmoreus]|uniref:Alpha-1,3-glucosyltransferase n=1 Tax=Hypsizygus marmoreus TaxID=39966 RepID=A0A369J6Z0_HYPMA|nr:Dolichyl pyrophosphate Man9GlcNAc2 alpha-1,3-glucosyltransferase [Hypsizygus marmoreus]
MDDELSALPPDTELRKFTSRIRTTSLGVHVRQAYHSPASPQSSTTGRRGESPLRRLSSPSPIPHHLTHEIHAPTPQRHLLESNASQHWLRTPPHSPTSSRAASPVSAIHTHRLIRHMSFSSLHEETRPRPRVHDKEKEKEREREGETMGRRWIRWMNRRGLKRWVVPGAILTSTLVKACISLGSYSGKGTPPMFGDYEAQRHWMELTVHLPLRQWYTYDLEYWGLDYPPLTAYISWICGKIGSWIDPAWFALDTSRGIETEGSKVFMRTTVVVCDALVYVPALLMFARTWQGTRSKRTQSLVLLTLLFQPALLLVDFGHFQYNSVMLGLTLLALNFFATGHDLVGAACFVLSLGFKQMSLYYAPAIGSYLLAKCIYLGPSQGGILFLRLALVTLTTLLLLFLPFLPPFAPLPAILDPISRIFPFARGLFEDKVANFWCASNVIVKWKNWASHGVLIKLSAGLTALGFLPSVGGMLHAGYKLRLPEKLEKPEKSDVVGGPAHTHTPFLPLLPYALLSSSMAFFLFSFQVHEKTILLPLLPITLLLSGANVDSSVYKWGVLVNNTAVFSMWPLLKRDGLGVQYIATLLLWNRLIGYNPFRLPNKSFIQLLSTAVYTAALSLHVLEFIFAPPSRYPDIYPVLNVLISTPVFVLTWLWSIKCGIEVGGGLGSGGGVAGERRPPSVSEHSVTADGAATGSFRQMGGRAVSLGVAQSYKRRATFGGSSRASSVVGAGDAE